ncbi:ComF family protein [Pseudidiomarina taiwanensis]|uniref:ComF family protein n=1 Tax=Pseudidiomarina taiwanensis TaxID=337250 RepID=A0A432ZL48_9GAMM|nr:ComF family protein [Pseudidiomarina taiwanensis]RUO78669.1 hypothetical protein CWI83_06525 [Pseudidiomarina taiwanensis]
MVSIRQSFAKLGQLAKVCWLCQQPLRLTDVGGFCDYCRADLPRLPPRCQKWRYGHRGPVFGDAWYAACAWHPLSQNLIRQLKFQGRPELAYDLAPLLAAQLTKCYQLSGRPWPDLIMPMPMTRKRWQLRGYNQAALLAKQVGQILTIPVAYGGLRRLHDRGQQHRSNRALRWQNMQQVFHCTRTLKQQRIALLDDVLTTGASVSAAAQVIQHRGATTVDAWVFALTEANTQSD